LPVTFTATATNGQEPLQYEWDFGDGTTGSGVSVSHTYVTTGTFQWEVTVTDVAGASVAANGTLLVTCPAIAVSPQVLSPGVRGNAYSQAFFANVTDGPLQGRLSESTNPLSWSESGPLPSGMTFSSGLLSGTPLEAGEFPITVACTDEYGCMASRSYTLSIECPDIAVYPASLPSGTAGMSYPPVSFSLTGGSGNIVWNLNGILPDGMDFGGDTLEGIPSQTGTFDLTFSATDRDGCSGSRRCFLVIGCPSVTVQQRSLPSTAVGALYDQSLSSSGGIEPYTYSVASGTLPPGVTLSAGGTLSGSPTASGTFAFTVDVTDANGCTGGAIYSIGVAPPPAVDLIRKVGSPFRLVVKGSNLQSGIRVFINDTEWNYLKYKSTSKIKLIGGRALKAVVPKGVSVNFAFVNPDGGRVVVLGWSR
jgi:PKD repeat protein